MSAPVAALPFTYKRTSDSYSGLEYTETTEKSHGLLRLEEDRLVIQWRVSRTTARMGLGYETKEETDPVDEAWVPLSQLAAAHVRPPRFPFGFGKPKLVITASDLRAFERVAGPAGLSMEHPSQLEFTLAKGDLAAGADFAGELELAISELQLRLAEAAGHRGSIPTSNEERHRQLLRDADPPNESPGSR